MARIDSTLLLKVSTKIFIISIFSLIVSFAKSSAFANYFGISTESDAYNMALTIPVTLFAIVEVAINTTIVPLYSEILLQEEKEKADLFLSKYISIFLLLSLIFILLILFFSNLVVSLFAPGYAPATKKLVVKLLFVMSPIVVLSTIFNIASGILKVNNRFLLPSFLTMLRSLFVIFTMFYCTGRLGIYAPAVGETLGMLLPLVLILFSIRRYLNFRFIIDISDPQINKALHMTVPIIFGIGAAEINKIIDRVISSYLDTGSLSALTYAGGLSSAIIGLLVTSVTTVTFPNLAKLTLDKESFANIYLATLSFFTILFVPLTAGSFLLASDILAVVFMHGHFDLKALDVTVPLFMGYMFMGVFVAFRQSSVQSFYAMSDTKTPMKNATVGIALNIVFNIIFAYYFGIIGLVMASILSQIIICVLLIHNIKKINNMIKFDKLKITFVKSVSAALIMSLFILAVRNFLSVLSIFNLFFLILGCIILYFITICVLKEENTISVLKQVMRRIGERYE